MANDWLQFSASLRDDPRDATHFVSTEVEVFSCFAVGRTQEAGVKLTGIHARAEKHMMKR